MRLSPLTKGASRNNTLELTELTWFKILLAQIREWEGSYAWKFGYTSPHAGVHYLWISKRQVCAISAGDALRNDFSDTKIRMGYHAEGRGPELLAVDEDLDDDGIVDEDEEDSDDYDNVAVTAAMRKTYAYYFRYNRGGDRSRTDADFF
ncbi:hypothetical protein GN958_ATG00133 [Phytophthora infestans]|uniref:Uncharacterized protein n=1 Tax=Phytophthora infestans TaxID=4787 RepID=A0A8S9VD53_PHYIN|nr:hypothetical protein GN958_ATG00133 [Phytophthora infestans]